MSGTLDVVVALSAMSAPFIALHVARTQAAHHMLVDAVRAFDAAVGRWFDASQNFLQAEANLDAYSSYKAAQSASAEVHLAYEAATLLMSRGTQNWLRRHWLKRQVRADDAIERSYRDADPPSAQAYVDDYALGWPTVRDVLRRTAGVRFR